MPLTSRGGKMMTSLPSSGRPDINKRKLLGRWQEYPDDTLLSMSGFDILGLPASTYFPKFPLTRSQIRVLITADCHGSTDAESADSSIGRIELLIVYCTGDLTDEHHCPALDNASLILHEEMSAYVEVGGSERHCH